MPRSKTEARRTRTTRRARRTPQARVDEIRARAAATSPTETSWTPAYGWIIVLFSFDGTTSMRDVPPVPYAEAVQVRDRELASSDRYTGAMLRRRIAPSPYDESRMAPDPNADLKAASRYRPEE